MFRKPRFLSIGLASIGVFILAATVVPPPDRALAQSATGDDVVLSAAAGAPAQVASGNEVDTPAPDSKPAATSRERAISLVEQFAANPDKPIDFLSAVNVASYLYAAYMHHDTAWPAGVLLILLSYLVFKIAKPRMPWFGTKLGGLCLNAIVGILGAFGTAFVAQGSGGITLELVKAGLKLAIGTAACVTFAKALLREIWQKAHDFIWPPAPAPVVGSSVSAAS